MLRIIGSLVVVGALIAGSVPATAQTRGRSTTVQSPAGRGATTTRSVDRYPGGISVDRSIDTFGGRHAEVSRDATRNGGGYQSSWSATGPNGGSVMGTRSRAGWYRPPPPHGYAGPRRGYYYAPRYGYYRVPAPYYGRAWAVGAVVPPPLRRYYVPAPSIYRLPPAPVGLNWIFVGNRIALVRSSSGLIVRLGPVFW